MADRAEPMDVEEVGNVELNAEDTRNVELPTAELPNDTVNGESETAAAKSEKSTDDKDDAKAEKKENVASAKSEKPDPKKDCDPKLLDLAFAMDCTGSMGSYIHSVSMRCIVYYHILNL